MENRAVQLFTCQVCGQTLYFENSHCTGCGSELGYLPDSMQLTALRAGSDGDWLQDGSEPGAPAYRKCSNYSRHGVCNWMIPVHETQTLCTACRVNTSIPDPGAPATRKLWQRLETAKHRLIYSLLRLGLPVTPRQEDPDKGLAFAFEGDADPATPSTGVVTGHADGLITIDMAEADPAARESVRERLAERYRTLLGHFRHESGHYYWDLLVRDSEWLAEFRRYFGDETTDYAASLQRYYEQGAPPDWQQGYISAYATAHPWEDWAETWAHYLHMLDTLETASVFGIHLDTPQHTPSATARLRDIDPYRHADFRELLDHWLPVTLALNSLNRSMGLPDPYPFVLSAPSIDKLEFVHRLVHAAVPAPQHAPDASEGPPPAG